MASIEAADTALRMARKRWKADAIRCVFIEEDAERFSNLRSCLERQQLDPGIKYRALNTSFVDGIVQLRDSNPSPFTSAEPIFAFIDPFGAKGMPFSVVRELLSRKTVEVLINLDSDGINRIYAAGAYADHHRILTETFGDESWKELQSISRTHERMQAILALYKSKLLAVPGVRYAFSFEMRSKSSVIDYHLVFASQHSLGLEKMKESMKQLDQDGTYRFCDEHVGQRGLFDFNDPYAEAAKMLSRFDGQSVPYASVNDYALNESPFVNAKAMLKELEKRNLVEVIADGSRRKNTYPDDRLKMTISFKSGAADG